MNNCRKLPSGCLLLAVAAWILASCGENNSHTASVEGAAEKTHEVKPLVFRSVPDKEKALDIAATHTLSPGEHVVVRGRIIGAERLFEEKQAMFLLADPAYVTPDDNGPRPCRASDVPAAVKRAHMLTVQISDEAGHILPLSLNGQNGLKELAYVAVAGRVSSESTASSPVIEAEAIEVIEAWPLLAPESSETETCNPWGGGGGACSTCEESACSP